MILGTPVPSSTADPQSQVQDHLNSESTSKVPGVDAESTYRTPSPPKQSFRVAKAIGLYPQTNTAVILDRQVTTISAPMDRASIIETTPNSLGEQFQANSSNPEAGRTSATQRVPETGDRIRGLPAKKDSKITWILATNKTGRSKYDQEEKIRVNGNASIEEAEDLTVLPLQEEVSRVRLVLNRTRSSSLSVPAGATGGTGIRTFNRSDDDVEIDEEFIEPQLLATAASILEVGVSESTRLSRARSAFPKDFQRDQVQEDHLSEYIENSGDNKPEDGNSSRSAVDIAAITGSCLAIVVLLSTMGSLGFIMYRRRYLNPPQTLNSDKCSNPDSSGYIDDSTIRDNSEEMYSLDNDSFLNSLEAMTIQNYWTDSVKHTKL